MTNYDSKIESGSFGRKISIIHKPFTFECERKFGELTEDDIKRYKELCNAHCADDIYDEE